MYTYPSHFEQRYLRPYDYYHYFHSPEYYYHKYGLSPRSVTSRYYAANPYISSYSDGRFELLRRTPFYTSYGSTADEEDRLARAFTRAVSVPRFERALSVERASRASSIPPRESSPVAVQENLPHSTRASSLPPDNARITLQPKIVHYSPKMVDRSTPSTTYTYQSQVPVGPEQKERAKITSANAVSYGPRIYTSLSVFPTNRHSSSSLLAPIDRFRYRTSTIPTKVYGGMGPSMSYQSYPTPASGTSYKSFKPSETYPTRHQINRINSPAMENIYAGRRTLY